MMVMMCIVLYCIIILVFFEHAKRMTLCYYYNVIIDLWFEIIIKMGWCNEMRI